MAKIAVTQNEVGQGGYTGFQGVMNVGEDMPHNYRPAITFIDGKGKRRDPYGRRTEQEGYAQNAVIAGSPEQKDSTNFKPQAETENSDPNLTQDELDLLEEERLMRDEGNLSGDGVTNEDDDE